MAYTDTPEDFDLDIFMRALGYGRGYLGRDRMEACGMDEDICLWSDYELTFIRRDGDQMTIEITGGIDDPDTHHDIALGRAQLIAGKFDPERVMNMLSCVEYRLPWPTTFDEAIESFRALGWFGKRPTRLLLMERYEALAQTGEPRELVFDLGDEQSITDAREMLRRFRR